MGERERTKGVSTSCHVIRQMVRYVRSVRVSALVDDMEVRSCDVPMSSSCGRQISADGPLVEESPPFGLFCRLPNAVKSR